MGGFLLGFGGMVLVLLSLVAGGKVLPLIVVGLFWLYRWAKKRPAQHQPIPAPVALPKTRPVGGTYGASDGSLGFEVPSLAGAPKSVGDGTYREVTAREMLAADDRVFREREKRRARQRRKVETEREQAVGASMAAEWSLPRLTPAAMADAVVLAEILSPPKALRGRRRGL